MRLNTITIFLRRKCYSRSKLRNLTTQADSKFKNGLSAEKVIPFEEIPGPSKFELFKRFLPGGKYYGADRRKLYHLCKEEYGKIFVLPGTFGKSNFLFVFDPEYYEEIYRTEGIWPERLGLETMNYYRNHWNPDPFEIGSLLEANGEDWAKLRKAVNPILMQPKTIGNYIPVINEVSDDFISRIKILRDYDTNEVLDNFKREISNLAVEFIAVIALNTRLGIVNGKRNDNTTILIESLDEIIKLTDELDFKMSIWRLYKTRKFKNLMKAFDNVTNVSKIYINQSFEKIKNSISDLDKGDQSVLERLLKIDERIATVMALEMFFAGIETTVTSLTACLLSLAKNQDKQNILRDEIQKILPNKNTAITAEKMKNLPYLRAVLKESMRLNPVIYEQGRQTGADIVIRNMQIPKGTTVLMVNVDSFRDDKYFSNPDKFIPERWLKDYQKVDLKECPLATKSSNPFVFLPFGFGPRICVGKRIANLELEILISKIIRNFKVEYNHKEDISFQLLLTFTPQNNLPFAFRDIE